MMHNNEQYYFWGMHAGWWIFALVLVVAFIGWNMQTRKRK
jgi:hypothetical protein